MRFLSQEFLDHEITERQNSEQVQGDTSAALVLYSCLRTCLWLTGFDMTTICLPFSRTTADKRFFEEPDIIVQWLSKKHLRFSFSWASTLAGSYFGLFSTFFSSMSFEKAQTGALGKFTGTWIPESRSNTAWVGNANGDSYLLTHFEVVTTTGLAISDFQVVPRTQQSCVLIFSNSVIIHVQIRH